MYNINMSIQTISTTEVRKNISEIVTHVKTTGKAVAVGRRNVPEVFIIPAPKTYNPDVSDIANLNAASRAFDFLADEPDIYTLDHIKKPTKK